MIRKIDNVSDIEVRITAVKRDTDGKMLCKLAKLYYQGEELPTQKNIWIKPTPWEGNNTTYKVDRYSHTDSERENAFSNDDIIIRDSDNFVVYNAALNAYRQHKYKQGNALYGHDRYVVVGSRPTNGKPSLNIRRQDFITRHQKEVLIRRLNDHFDNNYGQRYCEEYGVERPEQLTDEQLLKIRNELRREFGN